MMKKRIAVIGDNPEEILAKYSPDVEVSPYVKFELKNKEQMWKNAIAYAEYVGFPDSDIEKIRCMGPDKYWESQTIGLDFDNNGNAITTENPDQLYRDYANECDDIPVKDGGSKSQCLIDEIKFYDDGIAAIIKDKVDKGLLNQSYMHRFKDGDECVKYNSALFYTNDIVSENGCASYDMSGVSDVEWVCSFEENVKKICAECGSSKVTLYDCE